jgi:hypothetical protein
MGKGMKRSTRSLVGMFRPKSVASISSIDGAAHDAPPPQITVVNVEAERESVAVNPDPADLPRGATVFPKVEGSAAEVRRSASIRERAASENSQSRKSIVGGDRERADILAGIRKGILKSMFTPKHLHIFCNTNTPQKPMLTLASPHLHTHWPVVTRRTRVLPRLPMNHRGPPPKMTP